MTGDRPHLPLDAEPLPRLHPRELGTVAPGGPDVRHGAITTAEEPALWLPDAAPVPPRVDDLHRAPGRSAVVPSPSSLPATGGRTSLPWALAAVAGAWLLRRRSSVQERS